MWFTKIKLVWVYHQVPTAAADVHKTAVTTPFGLFEFPFICFGLRNAAQTFQRIMYNMLRGFDFCFAYIGNAFIASHRIVEHEQYVCAILKRCQDIVLPSIKQNVILWSKRLFSSVIRSTRTPATLTLN